MRTVNDSALYYATRFKQTTNDDNMILYEKVYEYQYTSGAGGESVFVFTSLIGLRFIQIEKQSTPMLSKDWLWNASSGQLTFLNGVTLGAGETIAILYARVIETTGGSGGTVIIPSDSVVTQHFTETSLVEESYGGVWYLPLNIGDKNILSVDVTPAGSTTTTRMSTDLVVTNTDWSPNTRISGFASNAPQTITIKSI